MDPLNQTLSFQAGEELKLRDWSNIRRGWSQRVPQTLLDALANMAVYDTAAESEEGYAAETQQNDEDVSRLRHMLLRLFLPQVRRSQVTGGGVTAHPSPCCAPLLRLSSRHQPCAQGHQVSHHSLTGHHTCLGRLERKPLRLGAGPPDGGAVIPSFKLWSVAFDAGIVCSHNGNRKFGLCVLRLETEQDGAEDQRKDDMEEEEEESDVEMDEERLEPRSDDDDT